ncbi:MAG: aminopeptidase P family N-terminal domain-containing protein, partial [Gemmatimonadota bacterium]
MTAERTGSHGRIASLDGALRRLDVGAAIVTHAPSVRYLTGFSGSSGCFYRALSGTGLLITDFRYEEQAGSETSGDVEVHISAEGWIRALADILADADIRVAFEPEHMTVLEYDRLEERVEGAEFEPAKGLVADLRAVKDESEIEAIGAAARVAETALEGLLTAVEWHSEPTEL